MTSRRTILTYVSFFLLIVAVQLLGGWATADGVRNWYPSIAKAAWNPPAWVFGPVWTALYLMIAISGARLWLALRGEHRHPVMRLYFAQLALNCLWSFMFFAWHQSLAALIDMIVMEALIIVLILHGRRVDRMAAWLLVPYALWVAYALTLNAAIVVLNS